MPHQVIESRAQLFAALNWAAEVEHNLLCLYLYAAVGLKRAPEEGATPAQLETIERWRRVILGVALEEMNHLTLVSNIIVAIGGSPHFMRPNFPVSPGWYPADLIIELAPFDLSTIEHFIYLERPAAHEVEDGVSFPHREHYVRQAPEGRLMPHPSDFPTVGSLYRSIRDAVERLSDSLGEDQLFSSSTNRQIGPLDASLPGLTLVSDQASAVRALDLIVNQGEGALVEDNSHFARFRAIHDEYLELLDADPSFTPSRPVARNPVMRLPIPSEDRVWIRNPLAARYLDLANTLYAFALGVLVQVFAVENRSVASKRALVETSIDVMHAMASVAETLTHLPANDDAIEVRAGITFAMGRGLAPIDSRAETALLLERLGEIVRGLDELQCELEETPQPNPMLERCIARLKLARERLEVCRARILRTPFSPERELAPVLVTAPPPVPSPVVHSATTPGAIEIARGKSLTVVYDARRCIHSRHCVTELPRAFKANTPGTWLFPDEADPDLLAAVIRECPSGALHYDVGAGRTAEGAPEVNLIRVRENGPYAVLANVDLDGATVGYRVTLCRCGKSQDKPFCDRSHVAAGFEATGEPATLDTTELPERAGTLHIQPATDGPLVLSGNVEVCAGTGRIVLRTVSTRLCRCGHSKIKPLCDGSHVGAGFVSSNESRRDA
jgi:CDGSH-type Zn-finger protein/uncharacterized Fe-S cluster protein YjdI